MASEAPDRTQEKLKSFSTYDFLVFDYLRRDEAVPDHLKVCLPGLVAAGAVESIGRDVRYLLARSLYAALGGKGVYTRKKGLDRETNKALLLKHIQDNAANGSQMDEFRQVLFALVRSQIQVLLRELRKDQRVHKAARLNDELMGIFDGQRVLYPDGFSKQEHNVRAVFYDGPGSFKSSVGVIAEPRQDEALLRFAAIYLRSSLARYFLMLRGWKMLCERNGVHLEDVKAFPFFAPEYAPAPEQASAALDTIARFSREIEAVPQMEQLSYFQQHQDRLDDSVFDYFGLSATERQLVRETVDVLMPSLRPRSYKSLETPIQ